MCYLTEHSGSLCLTTLVLYLLRTLCPLRAFLALVLISQIMHVRLRTDWSIQEYKHIEI